MVEYCVKQLKYGKSFAVDVPASKSLLNRALLLGALSRGTVRIICGALSQDTRAFLNCLKELGVRIEQFDDVIEITGTGMFPHRSARLNVQNAGTAARFLTVALAMQGGDYYLDASEQMRARPMDVISMLQKAGVRFTFEKEYGHLPFRLQSNGIDADALTVDTDISSQYASGLLLSAVVRTKPLTVQLTGSRTSGSYVRMTTKILRQFGATVQNEGDRYTVFPPTCAPTAYSVEADVSGACYFYALALLCRANVTVRGVHLDSAQGDIAFLNLLQERGVILSDGAEGVTANGTDVKEFDGFQLDMKDFSDQALTVAALAPFARTPTVIKNIGHIRKQECDRIHAIVHNLTALGVPVRAEESAVYIQPVLPHGGTIEPFGDHRVAMAFSLIGCRTGQLTVKNPDCCKKTFENYFELLSAVTQP